METTKYIRHTVAQSAVADKEGDNDNDNSEKWEIYIYNIKILADGSHRGDPKNIFAQLKNLRGN